MSVAHGSRSVQPNEEERKTKFRNSWYAKPQKGKEEMLNRQTLTLDWLQKQYKEGRWKHDRFAP